jgi:hypothetical protein
MGLVNIKRCVDSLVLESKLGRGTKLTMHITVPSEVIKGKKSKP